MTRFIPVLFVWLWSTGFIGAKYGLPYIEPFFMLAVRFCLTCLVLGAVILMMRKHWLTGAQLVGQMAVGVLLHGVYLGGVFYAIDNGLPAGISAIIVGLQPVVTAVISAAFLGERVGRVQLLGLLLGFVGLLLVVGGRFGLDLSGAGAVGVPSCVAALLGISAGTVLQKKLGTGVPLMAGALAQFAGAALVLGVISWASETQVYELTGQLVFAMMWLILGLSILAILLLMVMIREGEVALVSSYFYLVSPVTVIETWLLFGERLSPVSIFGCLLAVLGVFLVVRSPLARAG